MSKGTTGNNVGSWRNLLDIGPPPYFFNPKPCRCVVLKILALACRRYAAPNKVTVTQP